MPNTVPGLWSGGCWPVIHSEKRHKAFWCGVCLAASSTNILFALFSTHESVSLGAFKTGRATASVRFHSSSLFQKAFIENHRTQYSLWPSLSTACWVPLAVCSHAPAFLRTAMSKMLFLFPVGSRHCHVLGSCHRCP